MAKPTRLVLVAVSAAAALGDSALWARGWNSANTGGEASTGSPKGWRVMRLRQACEGT